MSLLTQTASAAPASRRSLFTMSTLLALVFLVIFNAPAHAQTPDLAPIVTMITGLVAVVASVGMAILTVYATIKMFKWMRAAF